jgi:hypothetical protein
MKIFLVSKFNLFMCSLQEKLSQMEAENQLLRKQALPSARQTSQNGTTLLPPLKQVQFPS